jgi:hypothetical protein
VTKIKNFRISLRAREIARLLKNRAQVQITPALEASIEHAMNDSNRLIQPAAVYTTLTRSTAEKATSLPLVDPAVAASVIAVTIGPALEGEIAAASGRQDAMQEGVLSALREEALHQAVQFVIRLIEGQAKEEECEMSAPRDVTEGVLVHSLGSLLGMQRIGIPLEQENPKIPRHARLVWTVWSPKVRVKSPAKSGQKAVVS